MKIFKINLIYFFSKRNVITLGVCLLINLFVTLFVVLSNQKLSFSITMQQLTTWETMFSFNKMLIVLLGCFLMNTFTISIFDNYKVLFIINLKNHRIYYISKILTVIFVIFCFVFLSFLFYLTINLFSSKNFILKIEYIKGFLMIFVIALSYSFISLLVTKLIDNTICVIIPSMLYMFSEFFEVDSMIFNTFFLSITINNLQNEFVYTIFHSLILLIFYLIIFLCLIKE